MRNANTQIAVASSPLSRADYERHLVVYLLTNLCLETELSREFARLRLTESADPRSRKSA